MFVLLVGLVWFGLVWFGLVWFGLVWLVWLIWFGLLVLFSLFGWLVGWVWFGLVWFGLVCQFCLFSFVGWLVWFVFVGWIGSRSVAPTPLVLLTGPLFGVVISLKSKSIAPQLTFRWLCRGFCGLFDPKPALKHC